MFSPIIKTTLRTIVTEVGGGIQCKAVLKLRTNPSDLEEQSFFGLGFSIDGLMARIAAEGEAIERATWSVGGLWNSVYFNKTTFVIPEEAELFLSKAHIDAIYAKEVPFISAFDRENNQVWIPSTAIFHFPFVADHLNIHSTTTGWAYHSSAERAIIKSYFEVIERDLICLFWYGYLLPYMEEIEKEKLKQWIKYLGFMNDLANLRVFQIAIKIPPKFGNEVCFSIVIYTSSEKPYLTIGSSIEKESVHSFQHALGELIMLRSNQYEQILAGKNEEENKFNFTSHVQRATNTITARDRIIELLENIKGPKKENIPLLDYTLLPYWTAIFAPPGRLQGNVAKVWVNGCQPMVPAGVPCGLVNRWKEQWDISTEEWQTYRWHPFP